MTTSAQTLRTGATQPAPRKERSLWADAWRRLARNRAAVAGLILIGVYALIALFAPFLAPKNPVEQTSNNSLRPPAWVQEGSRLTGNSEHLFGTDNVGRDVFSRLIYGSRVSLIVGFLPQFTVLLIGVGIGLVAGFAGGFVDNLLMRFTDIIYAFPDLLFLITLTIALRETWFGRAFNGLLLIFLALSIISWTGLARLVRGQVLSLKQKEFIEAARTIGVPTWKILLVHILPNTLAPIIVATSFAIPSAILAEAILTFLGVGMRPSLDPNNPFPTSWGALLQDGYNNLSSGPWMLLFPVLCIGSLMIAFTALGDGLRDALDPRDQ
jgi:oligopeptide transport system permease protein